MSCGRNDDELRVKLTWDDKIRRLVKSCSPFRPFSFSITDARPRQQILNVVVNEPVPSRQDQELGLKTGKNSGYVFFMRFVSVRDLRLKPGEVWRELQKERDSSNHFKWKAGGGLFRHRS